MVGEIRTKTKSPRRQNKPFQPAPGKDFGSVEEVDAKTRGFLARFVAYSSIVSLVAACGYGVINNSYTALMEVWAVAGPFIGAVVAYYFGPVRNDTG